jgi:light-harvesting protein B-800-850 alpha chain
MNQGKMWTTVRPSVGVPLILGSVAVTALLVHAAILTHTTWFASYWEGGFKARAAAVAAAPAVVVAPVVVETAPPPPATN